LLSPSIIASSVICFPSKVAHFCLDGVRSMNGRHTTTPCNVLTVQTDSGTHPNPKLIGTLVKAAGA
jgi:hypothetical protein